MIRTFCIAAIAIALSTSVESPVLAADDVSLVDQLKQSQRVVFLGDSITAAGQYVAAVEAWMLAQRWERMPKVICAGLPSETVSGLSEDGHAGGQFPRPDLAERLDRVLAVTKPDLVIACYGMNCAIYLPFSEERLAKYEQGLKSLKAKVEKADAKLILVTPPFYDDQRAPKDFSYNAVLDRYSDWLVARRQEGWHVIDLHTPMTQEMKKRREKDPNLTLQPDGVHPNDEGHWVIARQVIAALGDAKAAAAESPEAMLAEKKVPEEVLPLVRKRLRLLRDSYVGTAGHKRPGIAQGLPVDEAEAQAAELTAQIEKLMKEGPAPTR